MSAPTMSAGSLQRGQSSIPCLPAPSTVLVLPPDPTCLLVLASHLDGTRDAVPTSSGGTWRQTGLFVVIIRAQGMPPPTLRLSKELGTLAWGLLPTAHMPAKQQMGKSDSKESSRHHHTHTHPHPTQLQRGKKGFTPLPSSPKKASW